jgi:hypothetical protein
MGFETTDYRDFTRYKELLLVFVETQALNPHDIVLRQLYFELCTLAHVLTKSVKKAYCTFTTLHQDFLKLKKKISRSLTLEGDGFFGRRHHFVHAHIVFTL